MSLTDLKIRAVKATNKTQKLFDGRGLFLQVTPTGSKCWRLKYRFKGKEKLLAIGPYPKVSLMAAREQCEEAHKHLDNDIDPGEYRKVIKAATEERNANSFERIALEWFAKNLPRWESRYSDRVLSILKRDVLPWIGSKPISEITPPILLKVIRRIEERGAVQSAHRSLRICGQIFRYAVASAMVERDPSQDLKGALPPVKEKHLAAQTDPKQFAALLRVLDGYAGSLIVRCALRLAPLVFVRPNELRTAKWADIDFEQAEWRFLVTKTDTQHIVPLSTQSIAILQEIYPLTNNSPYVFPSARTNTRPMSDNAILAALRRLGISKEETTGHGFRASARTLLHEVLNVRPDCIEHQLAHAVRDPNGRAYNRTTFLDERKKMMQDWADYLDKIKQEK